MRNFKAMRMYLNKPKAAGENSTSLRLPFHFHGIIPHHGIVLLVLFLLLCFLLKSCFLSEKSFASTKGLPFIQHSPNPYSAALIPSATETLARRDVL